MHLVRTTNLSFKEILFCLEENIYALQVKSCINIRELITQIVTTILFLRIYKSLRESLPKRKCVIEITNHVVIRLQQSWYPYDTLVRIHFTLRWQANLLLLCLSVLSLGTTHYSAILLGRGYIYSHRLIYAFGIHVYLLLLRARQVANSTIPVFNNQASSV